MTFRLLVINPNSDGQLTEYLQLATVRVVPAGSVVEAVNCPGSPSVLETALDSVMAGPRVVDAALRANDPDAILVACFGDPAVSALRELTAVPVVGIGQAALIQASAVSTRFAVVTTLERGVPALWSQIHAAGLAGRCAGIRSLETGDDQRSTPDVFARLLAQGRRLLTEGADGLVLACAAFGPFSQRLAVALDVPVCDGIAVGACLAYSLAASGTTTSKRGGYAWPLTVPPTSPKLPPVDNCSLPSAL